MSNEHVSLKWWLIGLASFAVVVAMGVYLRQNSAFGIIDHQIAGTAERVNEIQAQWRADGLRGWAIASMIGDLIFIGIYGFGAWVAGRGFARLDNALLKIAGWAVAIAAAVFLVTDYIETILQVIQLVREAGSDGLAAIAAAMQEPKRWAFIVSALGVLVALVVRRISAARA